QVLALVSNVPGGLGVFESAVLLLLPADAPRAAVIGSLVAYRAIYYLVPLAAAAALLAGHELKRKRAAIGVAARPVGPPAGSLLKGFDWEEALVLSLMLATLLPCRPHFYRRASLLAQRFSAGWISAIAVALLGTVFLGAFAHKREAYSHELWWRFALAGDASR